MRLAFLLAGTATAMAVLGVAAAPVRQENPDAKTMAPCLNVNAEAQSRFGIVSVPIKTLFLDGATTTVNEVLCAGRPNYEDGTGNGWFRLNPTVPSKTEAIGLDFGQGEVTALVPSPDGKYLAAAYSAEGHPSIEVVDLPALMRHNEYKSLSLVGVYPGHVSIDRWEGGALIVASDMLLTRRGRRYADLFATEAFSLDVQSGKLRPLSDALNDPLRYFAAGLGASDSQTRMTAVSGLRSLDDQSAAVPLTQALAAERDDDVHADILGGLKHLAYTAELVDACMSSSAETLRKKEILAERIPAILVGGLVEATDQTICVLPPEHHWAGQNWYRVDRSRHPFNIVFIKESYGLTSLGASADGKLLAAQFASGDPRNSYVEIMDLGALMPDNVQKTVDTIYALPGSVSIGQWKDGDLHLTADVFLNHDPVAGEQEYDSFRLPLLTPETFVWRSDTASIVAPSGALHDPVQYYCAGLSDSKGNSRRNALRGLALLKDRSSVPCLELALANQANRDIQTEIRQTMERIIGR